MCGTGGAKLQELSARASTNRTRQRCTQSATRPPGRGSSPSRPPRRQHAAGKQTANSAVHPHGTIAIAACAKSTRWREGLRLAGLQVAAAPAASKSSIKEPLHEVAAASVRAVAWRQALGTLVLGGCSVRELGAKGWAIAAQAAARGACWAVSLSLYADYVSALRPGAPQSTAPGNAVVRACSVAVQWAVALGVVRRMGGAMGDGAPKANAVAAVARASRWQLAVRLAADHGLDGRHAAASAAAAVGACGQQRRWQVAMIVAADWAGRQKAPTAFDISVWNSAATACARSARWREALAALARAPPALRDSASLGALGMAYEAAMQWQAALGLLASPLCKGSGASAHAIRAMASSGHWRAALSALGRMRSQGVAGVPVYASAAAAAAKYGGWKAALGVAAAMRSASVTGNAMPYNIVLSTFFETAHEEEGDGERWQWSRPTSTRWRVARALLLQAEPEPDCHGVASAVRGSAREAAWREALGTAALWPHLAQGDAAACHAVSCALATGTQWRGALGMTAAALKLGQQQGRAATHQELRRLITSAITAARVGTAWHGALRLLRRLREPDRLACTAALSACAGARQWREALALAAQSPEVDRLVLGQLLRSAGMSAHWRQGIAAARACAAAELSPGHALNAAAAAASRGNEWRGSLGIIQQLLDRGERLHQRTHTQVASTLRHLELTAPFTALYEISCTTSAYHERRHLHKTNKVMLRSVAWSKNSPMPGQLASSKWRG
eukprot:TRINITY_DN36536_c0_g1_i1.p1 TRINITY_DN36536_c0_g1~~TRINITY_DN36536_c0_g1_i1.p1  ORF type:complete len:736 (+),score=101.73 TRINITY_DN36536_c0_g1_i1:92-2299(+)